MKITPLASNIHNHHKYKKNTDASSNFSQSFGAVNFYPEPNELKKIYKNGPDIYNTLLTAMKRIDKRFKGAFHFLVRVDYSREPRVIRINAKVAEGKRNKMLRLIFENGIEEGLHPRLRQAAKQMYEGKHKSENDYRRVSEILEFLKEEIPVARLNYVRYGEDEKKVQFIKELDESLTMKKILEKMNKECHGKPDFNTKKSWLDRKIDEWLVEYK